MQKKRKPINSQGFHNPKIPTYKHIYLFITLFFFDTNFWALQWFMGWLYDKTWLLQIINTWPTKSNYLSLTPHKASPPQPNGTFAEYVDVYSPLLYTPTPPPSSGCQHCNHCSGEDEAVEGDFQEFQDYDEF